MARSVTTFLMFQDGRAEEALHLYAATFAGAQVGAIERFGAGEQGAEGSIRQAWLTIAGHDLRVFDSPVDHAFDFTPAVSLFVECADEQEQDAVWAVLCDGGAVHMPLADYGFSRRFGWLDDRFGVSWQLNLA